MKLPLFTLPIYLLPGGMTRLRIFEQRYLNMVKNSSKTNGFAIRYSKSNEMNNEANWASWVEIIDFNTSDDGILTIDVQCKSLVMIDSTALNHDELLIGEVSPKEYWSDVDAYPDAQQLREQLKLFFQKNNMFEHLYIQTYFDQSSWVCSRWLELIPVSFDNKEQFLKPDSFHQAVKFLNTIIKVDT